MNYIFVLDSTYTPYNSNKDITLSNNLVSGAKTVTGICVNPNGGTFSNGGNSSVTSVGCDIMILSATCADGTSLKNSEEFENASPIGFDGDIQRKVASYSGVSDEQKKSLALALQLHKEDNNNITFISDSATSKSILAKEGVVVKTYEESGIPYGWTCHK